MADTANPASFAFAAALMNCSPPQYTIETLLKQSTSPSLKQAEEDSICSVCKDEASGRHYGVVACFGCKGFFRRTVRAGKNYVCRYEQRCRIDKTGRNVCRSCRFQKCLEVGMEPDAIRPDRDKTGRQKNPRRPSLGTGDGEPLKKMSNASLLEGLTRLGEHTDNGDSDDNRTSPSSRADSAEMKTSKLEVVEGVLQTLVQIEHICEGLRDVASPPSTMDCPLSLDELVLRPSLICQRFPMEYSGDRGRAESLQYSESVRRLVVLLFDYSNTLKPIADLSAEEKVAIVRNCASSFCLLTLAYRSVKSGAPSCSLFLPNGHVATRDDPVIDTLCTDDKRVIEAEARIRSLSTRVLDQVVALVRRLDLSETEFVALKAILALDPHGPALSDLSATLLMVARESVMGALYARLHSSGLSPIEAANRFGSLLLLVANVSKYGSLACATMQYCRDIGVRGDPLIDELLLKED